MQIYLRTIQNTNIQDIKISTGQNRQDKDKQNKKQNSHIMRLSDQGILVEDQL